MKRLTLVLAVAVVALTALLGVPARAPVANADPATVLTFNPGICLALMGGTTQAINTCGQPTSLNNGGAAGSDAALLTVADTLGNNNGVIEPSDFTGVDGFTGGQIHQQDGTLGVSRLVVLAFVKSNTPVLFRTTAGTFVESNSPIYNCTAANDFDCGAPPAPLPNGQDHVVVAQLTCSAATCPVLGAQSLTVQQDGIVFPITFTVVGEPRTVSFFTLETGIQAGMPYLGTLSNRNAKSGTPCVPPACASVSLVCPFAANLPFIQKALAEAEKTVIVARTMDINGTAISGAWINWTVDNNGVPTPSGFSGDGATPTNFDSQGILAQPSTPTLNLGGFGYGAPNILCAPFTAKPGAVTVRATVTRSVSGLAVDGSADPGSTAPNLAYAEKQFTVTGFPADVTLASTPAQIACDGTASAKVSAAIVDGSGNKAISGTAVHFDVQVLGTASPIDTTTNGDGVATTTVTPLAGGTSGVPVTVSVTVGGAPQPQLTRQILVACAPAAPPAGGQPAGGGAAPAGGAGAGGQAPSGIIAPNTGSGPLGAPSSSVSWWPAVALLGGALALAALRLGRAGIEWRRRS